MPRHPVITEDIGRVLAADLPWDELRGRTVLVTGAAGFLPAYMVETFLELNDRRGAGVHVLGLVRDRAKADTRFAHHAGRGDFEFLVQDVCEPIPPHVRADIIVHAASQASPKFYGRDPVGTLAANAIGTHQLLGLAQRSGARAFLYFSTSEVYGQADSAKARSLSETDYGYLDPAQVRACYGEGKRLGETLCVCWHHQYGVPAKVVRPFHTYGPGMALDDGRVFADFVADVLARRPIVLRSAGTARRAFCYLADATAGFFTVLLKGTPGQAYNVGNPAGELSIRDLAELVAGLFPELGLTVRVENADRAGAYLASAVSRNAPDIAKVRALGWEPTVGPADGFRRTIRSFQ